MKPLLGRVRGGPGVFTVALIDHSISFLESTNGKYDHKYFQLYHEILLKKKKCRSLQLSIP